jgi:hypothetical protein
MWTSIFILTLFWIGAVGMIAGLVLGTLEVVFFLAGIANSIGR